MSTRSRLNRRTADRLLDAPTGATGPVAELLRAASAPSEPAGEETAVAQFRAARTAAAPGRSTVRPRAGRKLLALPVAGLAAGLLAAGGGVALAASQGSLHVPFTGHDHRSSHAPSAPTSQNPGLSGTHSPATHAPETPGAQSTNVPSGTPSPSLDGLCKAFQAGAVVKSADNPAFAALSTAAGGADKVSAYCVDRIGAPARPTHPAKPTQAATPTHPAMPTQAPAAVPTAKPTRAGTHAATPGTRPSPQPVTPTKKSKSH